ncbi:MAG: hypothetical protein ABI687_00820 [Flavitalea sp.]
MAPFSVILLNPGKSDISLLTATPIRNGIQTSFLCIPGFMCNCLFRGIIDHQKKIVTKDLLSAYYLQCLCNELFLLYKRFFPASVYPGEKYETCVCMQHTDHLYSFGYAENSKMDYYFRDTIFLLSYWNKNS